jgi:glycosyltransferase involved in cell wall biosynthesis
VRAAAVIPSPIVVEDWPLRADKQDYLLWMGRMDPVKGAHRAILAARLAGHRLVLAGPVQPEQHQYFAREIEPHIDGQRVMYVGEVGGMRRKQLFAGAKAFLLAFPEGAASEIVIDGVNGFLVADEREMAQAVGRLDLIDSVRCRHSVAKRYDLAVVAENHEAV